MNTGFRLLTDREQQALQKMLAVEFPNHQVLEAQLDGLTLRECDETLYYLAPFSAQLDEIRMNRKTFGVPVEGAYRDEDGAIVFVWLFSDEHNALVELEIWKPDGSAVITYFADANLAVKVLEVQTSAKSEHSRSKSTR